jgi:hypothetical protein
MRLEGLGQLKNPMPLSGLESATFQLAAHCLNQLCYRLPQFVWECNFNLLLPFPNI